MEDKKPYCYYKSNYRWVIGKIGGNLKWSLVDNAAHALDCNAFSISLPLASTPLPSKISKESR